MATIYTVEVVSHWVNYPKEELEKILQDAIKIFEKENGNTIQIRVTERK